MLFLHLLRVDVKIIHVINDLFAYGGTPKKLRYLVKYANADKCSHVFICVNSTEIQEDFCDLPVKIYQANGSVFTALSLIKSQLDGNSCVICVHFFKAFIVGVIASKIFNIPLVNNEHGSAYYRGGYKTYVMRLLKLVPKTTICNSKYVRSTIQDQFNFPEDKLMVVYNPVERRYKKESFVISVEVSSDSLVIGHVGGFIKQRDQIILIEAVFLLREKGIHASLILIGDGPEKAQLENRCRELGIVQLVHFIGYTDAIGNWLDVFDVYINPTIDEGFGIAVVEAMLSDVPVIAANAGAHKEIIEDKVNGLLYSPGNVTSLLEKLFFLLDNPGDGKALSDTARRMAEEQYAPLRYANSYHRILDQVVLVNQNL